MVAILSIMSPNHNPPVASFERFPGYESVPHNPTAVLLTCHNPHEKVSPETRDFRADIAGRERRVASRRNLAGKKEPLRKRNLLRGLAIVTGEGTGSGMGARENPGVTNFATPGFKW